MYMWTMSRGRHWEKMVNDICLCLVGICNFGARAVISEAGACLLRADKSEETLHRVTVVQGSWR